MVWREQKDHVTDCYFCLTNVQGHNNVNLLLFCHYFRQAICDCIVQYVVTLCNVVVHSDPCTRDISYAKHKHSSILISSEGMLRGGVVCKKLFLDFRR